MEKTGQWERIKELFDAALELKQADREQYLSRACEGDPSLRAEVDSLLSAYARSDELSQPAIPIEMPEESKALQFIGPYRLIRKLGEGGMGQVWLAEQTEPLRRQVALKLIRAGLYDESLIARFLAERQSLALMEHPAIAKVFDAGATLEGQPYLVMEYVPGDPITKYCDQHNLSIKERLKLFIKACEGVLHAHQKAIIHRDLKPANILVIELDGQPTPRIIDFGLALAVQPQAEVPDTPTRPEIMVGTPGYMSPEQAGAGDIDTRTDVYSLGVVLYELLTGRLPFDVSEWRRLPVSETVRHIQEQVAIRPSLKAAEKSRVSVDAAERRGTQPRRLAKQLAGDLDLIATKALEKDRQRRYGTPSELAADIRRTLDHYPVDAHPPSATYQIEKYVRRHRLGVAMTALLALILPAFVVVQAVELRRIARERDRASRIADFMTGMFKVSDPSEARGNQATAREILDKASKEIDTGLKRDPDLQSDMMFVMGKVYDNLGLYSRSDDLLRGSAAIRQRELGEKSPETVSSMVALGWTLDHEGRYAEAEKLQRQTLENARRALGPRNAGTLQAMRGLGYSLAQEGQYPEAEKLQREAADGQTRLLGAEHPDTLATMNNLAWTLQQRGRLGEAEQMYRQVVEGRTRVLGPEDPETVIAMNNLAVVLVYERRYADAEKEFRQVLDIRQRILGPDHPDVGQVLNNLAITLRREGHLADSEAMQQQALELYRRVVGPEHPWTLQMMNNLAQTWAAIGKYKEAERLVEQARNIQLRVLPPDAPTTAISTYNLASFAAREGRRDLALSLAREAVDHGLPPLADIGIGQDPDFKSLHGDPRFDALVKYASHKAPSASRKQ